MSHPNGKFVWYELLTTDTEAARAFYTSILGWHAQDVGGSPGHYTAFSVGASPVAGLMVLPEEARALGARPAWMGYIGVDDVDVVAARVTQAGGTLYRAAEDVPGVGRFAVVADPQGAPFTLFTAAPNQSRPAPPAAGTHGTIGWHELHAADREAAFAFYADMFGWTKTTAVDMGPMGLYQMFATPGGAGGGMMTKDAAMPGSFWSYYINVDSIEAAVARVKAASGQILQPPTQVPGGSWITIGLDPQGAMFALVGKP
jgi:predicted enzyme related to lactoylglutathione lyase